MEFPFSTYQMWLVLSLPSPPAVPGNQCHFSSTVMHAQVLRCFWPSTERPVRLPHLQKLKTALQWRLQLQRTIGGKRQSSMRKDNLHMHTRTRLSHLSSETHRMNSMDKRSKYYPRQNFRIACLYARLVRRSCVRERRTKMAYFKPKLIPQSSIRDTANENYWYVPYFGGKIRLRTWLFFADGRCQKFPPFGFDPIYFTNRKMNIWNIHIWNFHIQIKKLYRRLHPRFKQQSVFREGVLKMLAIVFAPSSPRPLSVCQNPKPISAHCPPFWKFEG